MLYTLEDVERFSWVGSVRYTDPARPLISGCLESTRPVVCLDRDLSEDCVDRFFFKQTCQLPPPPPTYITCQLCCR